MSEEDADRATMPWPRQAEKIRSDYVRERCKTWAQSGKRVEYSLAWRLLDEMSKEAIKLVRIDDRHREFEIDLRLNEVDNLVTELMHAAMSNEDQWEKREEPNFWSHSNFPVNDIKNKSHRIMLKNEVEAVAEHYLAQPHRHILYDRTLVDMLLALELYLFADETFHPPNIPGIAVRSAIKQPHPLWVVTRDMIVITAVLVAIGWFCLNSTADDPSASWAGWVAGVCFLLWILAAGWSVVALPGMWIGWRKARTKTLAVFEAMLMTYAQMQSSAVISAQHVLDSAKASAAQGVVWPSPLYVVLEDVLARGGRL